MQLKGSVKTVTFHNPDNGYSVLKLQDFQSRDTFTVVGIFPRVGEGEMLEVAGDWSVHPVYGRQFKSNQYKSITPETPAAIEIYLASGLFKGVGPAQAKAIVQTFGANTFKILDLEPHRLEEVKGMGRKKRTNLMSQWSEKQSARQTMVFLQSNGISLRLSGRLHEKYGEDTVNTLKENPYRLAHEMWGIGFLKADEIAGKLGLKRDSYERIKAGLIHALTMSSETGHVFLTKGELVSEAVALLQCPENLVVYALDHLEDKSEITNDGEGRYYRPYLYRAETGAGSILNNLLSGIFRPPPSRELERGLTLAEAALSKEFGNSFTYLEQQKAGIRQAAASGVFLLTGGPGTGKTTTLKGILNVFLQARLRVKLAAPTGRAAKRMGEVMSKKASTIHRLLKFEPESGRFYHDEDIPLSADALIVDEVSMIDTGLMYSLLRAVSPGTRLVLVGDPDQLPSVGPGKVLSELINSHVVPHLHLDTIMRQADASKIVLNAHRINRGRLPDLRDHGGEFYFFSCPNAAGALDKTLELVCRAIPQKFSYDPLDDLQVLTPMNRGPLGTQALNQELQKRLNTHDEGLSHRNRVFKIGDKVMQIRNNYDKNVFNGDIGRILSINGRGKSLRVLFEKEVEYGLEELEQLNLAYAATIHKSQGSEYRAVLVLLTNNHYIMLQRNLFYTALTRARERVFLVGTVNAVKRAVEHNPVVHRNTRLAHFLRKGKA